MKKLKTIAEYVKFILTKKCNLCDMYIISKTDPKNCPKKIKLTNSLILRPNYIYLDEKEILKRVNTLKTKIENKENLSFIKSLGLAMLPILSQDNIAEKVTTEACELIQKDKSITEELKTKLCFLINMMIERNIKKMKIRVLAEII